MLKHYLNKSYTVRDKWHMMGHQKFMEYVEFLEKQVIMQMEELMMENEDWDSFTLAQKWEISYEDVAKCRAMGLEYYKKGRKYFYTPEARKKFLANNQRVSGRRFSW